MEIVRKKLKSKNLKGKNFAQLTVKFFISLVVVNWLSAMPLTVAAEPTKLLLAHGAISNNVAPWWVAKEQGIFRKYGIDADLVFIIAGRAMQAV